MKREFEVTVHAAPTSDAEERLRKVFDILLMPLCNGEDEPHSGESDQLPFATQHPADTLDNLANPSLATAAQQEFTKQ